MILYLHKKFVIHQVDNYSEITVEDAVIVCAKPCKTGLSECHFLDYLTLSSNVLILLYISCIAGPLP